MTLDETDKKLLSRVIEENKNGIERLAAEKPAAALRSDSDEYSYFRYSSVPVVDQSKKGKIDL